jgi:hypothetical protein
MGWSLEVAFGPVVEALEEANLSLKEVRLGHHEGS